MKPRFPYLCKCVNFHGFSVVTSVETTWAR